MSSVTLYCSKKNIENLIDELLKDLFIRIMGIDVLQNFPYSLIPYFQSNGTIYVKKERDQLHIEIEGNLECPHRVGLKVTYKAKDEVFSTNDELVIKLVTIGRELIYKANNVHLPIKTLLAFNEDLEINCWYSYVMTSTGSEK